MKKLRLFSLFLALFTIVGCATSPSMDITPSLEPTSTLAFTTKPSSTEEPTNTLTPTNTPIPIVDLKEHSEPVCTDFWGGSEISILFAQAAPPKLESRTRHTGLSPRGATSGCLPSPVATTGHPK